MFDSIVCTLAGKSMDKRLLHPEKAHAPIVDNWESSAKVTSDKLSQPKNILFPIVCTPAGMVMDERLIQSMNAHPPIDTNLGAALKEIFSSPEYTNAQ